MDSSFTPIEQMLKFRASRHEDFPGNGANLLI